jgi:hypothetical protein
MPTYLPQEEIRMRVLEGEVEGEKAMRRYILRRRQHGDELILARSELERKRGSIVCGEIALMSGVRPFGAARRAGTRRRSIAPGAGERRRHMDKMRADIDTTCSNRDTVRAGTAAIRAAVATPEPRPGA